MSLGRDTGRNCSLCTGTERNKLSRNLKKAAQALRRSPVAIARLVDLAACPLARSVDLVCRLALRNRLSLR